MDEEIERTREKEMLAREGVVLDGKSREDELEKGAFV